MTEYQNMQATFKSNAELILKLLVKGQLNLNTFTLFSEFMDKGDSMSEDKLRKLYFIVFTLHDSMKTRPIDGGRKFRKTKKKSRKKNKTKRKTKRMRRSKMYTRKQRKTNKRK